MSSSIEPERPRGRNVPAIVWGVVLLLVAAWSVGHVAFGLPARFSVDAGTALVAGGVLLMLVALVAYLRRRRAEA